MMDLHIVMSTQVVYHGNSLQAQAIMTPFHHRLIVMILHRLFMVVLAFEVHYLICGCSTVVTSPGAAHGLQDNLQWQERWQQVCGRSSMYLM